MEPQLHLDDHNAATMDMKNEIEFLNKGKLFMLVFIRKLSMLLGQGGLNCCEALPSWLSPIVTQERPQDHHDNHVEGTTSSQLHNII